MLKDEVISNPKKLVKQNLRQVQLIGQGREEQQAKQGVDISPEKSRLNPRGRRLADTTKGGPVKTFKPTQPAPAPKPETVKKPVPTLSKRGALSKEVDPVLKGLRKQGALERRMSAAVDSRSASSKELADKAKNH